MSQTDRKKQLIAQGALHRTEIMMAKDAVRDSVRPEALAHTAMQQLAATIHSALGKTPITGLRDGVILRTAFPLLLTAISTLAKRKVRLKFLLGSFLAASLTTFVVTAMSRKKKTVTAGTAPDSQFM